MVAKKKKTKFFDQTIYRNWCKSCGICIALCPKTVYDKNDMGGPVAARPDDCIGCLICEQHCPDFAISITERAKSKEAVMA
jgi:2-oxoglutarate ferredoxin oxidoreductase subunit delta